MQFINDRIRFVLRRSAFLPIKYRTVGRWQIAWPQQAPVINRPIDEDHDQ